MPKVLSHSIVRSDQFGGVVVAINAQHTSRPVRHSIYCIIFSSDTSVPAIRDLGRKFRIFLLIIFNIYERCRFVLDVNNQYLFGIRRDTVDVRLFHIHRRSMPLPFHIVGMFLWKWNQIYYICLSFW